MSTEFVIASTLTANNKSFNREHKESELQALQTAKAIAVETKAVKENVRELKNAETPNKQAIADQLKRLDGLRKSSEALGIQRKQLQIVAKEAKVLALAEKEATKGIQAFNNAIGFSNPLVAAITVAVGTLTAGFLALGKSVSTFGEFERTLNTIAAVSGATAGELDAIKQSSIDLGQTTIFTNQQVADSYLNLSKAGLTAAQSLEAMPGVLNLAAISGGDLANAAEIVAGTLAGFGLEADKAIHVTDLLAVSANKSQAGVGDLGEAFKVLAPVARSANQSIEDSTALLSVLANNMIKGADAGSDLRGILVRLIDPPKDAAVALKKMGIEIADSKGKIRPLIDIVEDLQKSLAKFNQKGRNKIIADIAGLENLKTLSALVNTSKEDLEAMRAEFGKVDGAGVEMANRINQGLVPAYQAFTGSLETAFIQIGQALAPAVIGFLKILTDFMAVVNRLLPPILALTAAWVEQQVAVFKLIVSVTPLGPLMDGLFALMGDGKGIVDALGNAFLDLAENTDRTAVALKNALIDIKGGFEDVQRLTKFSTSTLDAVQSGQDRRSLEKRANEAESQIRIKKLRDAFSGIKNLPKASGKVKPPPGDTGGADYTGAGKKPKKVRDTTARDERQRISDMRDALQDNLRSSDLQFRGELATLGPFASQASRLDAELEKNKRTIDSISAAQKLLAGTTFKSKEAIREKTKVLKDLALDLRSAKLDTAELGNQQKQLARDLELANNEFERQKREAEAGFTFDRIKAANSQEEAETKRQFDKKLITAKEYYAIQEELVRKSARLEREEILFTITQLKEKEAELLQYEDKKAEVQQIQLDILKQQYKLKNSKENENIDVKKVTNAAQDAQDAIGDRIYEATEGALSDAIYDAFTGQGTAKTLADFAKQIWGAIAREASNQIASLIMTPLRSAFQSLGKGIGNITQGQGGAGSTSQLTSALSPATFSKLIGGGGGGGQGLTSATSFSSLLKNPAFKATAGAALGFAIQQGGTALAGGSKSAGRAGAGVALGVGGGALAGAAIGSIVPVIGTALGAIIGGALGGTATASSNAGKGGFFSSKAGIATAFALGGPLGFFALAAADKGRKARRAAEAQKNEAKNTDYVNTVFGRTDTNNLTSLYASRDEIQAQLNYQTKKHKVGKAPLNNAIAELNKAIEDRKKAIENAIKEINKQNADLIDEIRLVGATSFDTITITHEQALRQLAQDTADLLDQFKDSEEAKTKILENEALKRQLISKQEQENYKDAAQNLQDLLEQRDAIANANVFTRAKSAEQTKSDELAKTDKDIAAALLDLQSYAQLGTTSPTGALADVINKAASLSGDVYADLKLTINESVNSAETKEMIDRAFEAFSQKIFNARAV